MTTTAVCILTYRRPEWLRAALEGVARLLPPPGDVHVVVVDNDSQESARPVVDAVRDVMPFPLHYVVEPRRGISYGRNLAVAEARLVGADLLAFMDDDEVPSPGWLDALVRFQAKEDADAVMGPVIPTFDVPAPEWMVRGRFFERPRRVTGSRMRWGTTSNVLIAMPVFADETAPFAEMLALTGGEDTHFFQRVRPRCRIFWCDEAEVVEKVPATRMSVRWLLARRYRFGNTVSLCLRDFDDRPLRRLKRTVGALGRIAGGLGLALVGVVRGRAGIVSGLQLSAYGIGQLTGLVGRHYEEYGVIHGR